MLIYHNITPLAYFERSDPLRMELARLGRSQLLDLRVQTGLALAVSPYNEVELHEAGFEKRAVLPLPLEPSRYDLPLNKPLAARLQAHTPRLLFVGRLAPNKKQEDLLKLLFFYRRFEPRAHLYLVGDRWEVGYDKWVESLARELRIADGLTLTGKVSQQDLVTYYRSANLFVSMSEHEGFGMPLVESMYCSLPVVAYGVTGVPYTLGEAGVQFFKKDFEALAELVDWLIQDDELRGRIVARQDKRVQKFLEPTVRAQFERLVQQAGIL
jgi:glycosyltransferase involved in cell wall biosynthesis